MEERMGIEIMNWFIHCCVIRSKYFSIRYDEYPTDLILEYDNDCIISWDELQSMLYQSNDGKSILIFDRTNNPRNQTPLLSCKLRTGGVHVFAASSFVGKHVIFHTCSDDSIANTVLRFSNPIDPCFVAMQQTLFIGHVHWKEFSCLQRTIAIPDDTDALIHHIQQLHHHQGIVENFGSWSNSNILLYLVLIRIPSPLPQCSTLDMFVWLHHQRVLRYATDLSDVWEVVQRLPWRHWGLDGITVHTTEQQQIARGQVQFTKNIGYVLKDGMYYSMAIVANILNEALDMDYLYDGIWHAFQDLTRKVTGIDETTNEISELILNILSYCRGSNSFQLGGSEFHVQEPESLHHLEQHLHVSQN